MVNNLPAMQEIRVQSLGQEDPVEKGMATHSSILAWRLPWTEEPGKLQYIGSQRVSMTEPQTLWSVDTQLLGGIQFCLAPNEIRLLCGSQLAIPSGKGLASGSRPGGPNRTLFR